VLGAIGAGERRIELSGQFVEAHGHALEEVIDLVGVIAAEPIAKLHFA
jgi:hypothetical protein